VLLLVLSISQLEIKNKGKKKTKSVHQDSCFIGVLCLSFFFFFFCYDVAAPEYAKFHSSGSKKVQPCL
jgi:hypothetical protein